MTTATRPVERVVHGPTWTRDERGRFVLPRRTLGWQSLGWTAEHLQHPDGPRAGMPWEFTDEQARFWLWWYAVDAAGRFIYRGGVLRRMKGWGKDPLCSVLSANELLGPCRFDRWGPDGQPIAVPHPAAWVQIAAVSKEQTKNTMTLFGGLFTEQTLSTYDIDLGKEVIYAQGGRRRLEAVTSSPRALEGGRPSFVLENEPQHWVANNDGWAMDQVITRNLAKAPDGSARKLGITNAHRIGERSVAEQDWEAYDAAGPDAGMLYDSIEAPEDTVLVNAGAGCDRVVDDEPCDGVLQERADRRLECSVCGAVAGTSLRAGLEAARGDSIWVPITRLEGEIADPRSDENQARRFYLNQLRSEVNSWIRRMDWEDAEDAEYAVPAGVAISLGFDGSRSRDATGIVATELRTGFQWVVQVWERPDLAPADWEVDPEEVDLAMIAAFEQYRVARLHADPYWWEETLSTWAGRWGSDRVVAWPTNANAKRMALAVKSFEKALRTRASGPGDEPAAEDAAAATLSVSTRLTHAPDEVYARHIANAVKQLTGFKDEDGEPLYLIRKENKSSTKKMDLAMAGVLSWGARNDAIASGALADTTPKKPRAFVFGGGDS